MDTPRAGEADVQVAKHFAQPNADAVRAQLDNVADMLGRQFPEVKEMLLEAKEDLTAFADFPNQHWKNGPRPAGPVSAR
ncbi:transposase [Streptomyces sp. NPDC059851]|uniref:transposase n=1 Tax=Streptomyces sp. NPDC059851 TaxID=3346971 RepID=UPI00364E061C